MEQQTEGVRRALQYIEEHITETLDVTEVARQAYLSPYHFQRIFAAACGIHLGEYIRGRRLTLAGDAIIQTKQKIVDIAAEYGYESQDGFRRAFQIFHGITPTEARRMSVLLRRLEVPDLYEQVPQDLPNYRIEEKDAFYIQGISYTCNHMTSHRDIPEIWDAFLGNHDRQIRGMYGLCIDRDGDCFEYLIADPCCSDSILSEKTVIREIPASLWAVFPCTLSTLQDTTTRMWRDWIPENGQYRLGLPMNIERYFPLNKQGDTACELWLPIETAI